MRSVRSLSVVIGIATAAAMAAEPVDLVGRLEALTSESMAAGYATRKRLLEGLREELDGRRGSMHGVVTNVTTFRLDDTAVDGTPRGRAAIRWEHGGLSLPAVPWNEGRERLAAHLGGRSEGTLVMIRAGTTLLYAIAAAPEVVDRVRTGQRAFATVEVSGLFNSTFFGLLLQIDSEVAMLTCPSGHAFARDTGFRYCPFDGAALTAPAEPDNGT